MAVEEADEVAALREMLVIEQRRSKALAQELQQMRETIVNNAMKAEAEEECISNKLTRRLADLAAEKARLAIEVEREEELISNTLQKQLAQLRKDKVELENQLEQEQEAMVNKLQRQVATLEREKHAFKLTVTSFITECHGQIKAAADSGANAQQTLVNLGDKFVRFSRDLESDQQ